MALMQAPVRVFVQQYECDHCKAADMRPNGEPKPAGDKMKDGWLFPHKCPVCGHEQDFEVQYPNYHFEPVPDAPFEPVDVTIVKAA